jgi:hypothetical protein
MTTFNPVGRKTKLDLPTNENQYTDTDDETDTNVAIPTTIEEVLLTWDMVHPPLSTGDTTMHQRWDETITVVGQQH